MRTGSLKNRIIGFRIEKKLFAVPFFLTVSLFLCINIALNAEPSNILEFNGDSMMFKERNEPLPYGEKIVIDGSLNSRILDVSVTALYGLNKQEAEVTLNGDKWTAITGPFPMRANVTFIIKQKRNLSDKEIGVVTVSLINAVNKWTNVFLSSGQSLTKDSLIHFITSNVDKEMEPIWYSYTSLNNQPVNEVIMAEIRSLMENNTAQLLNSLNELVKLKNDDFYKYVLAVKAGIPSLSGDSTTDNDIIKYLLSVTEKEKQELFNAILKTDTTVNEKILTNLFNQTHNKCLSYSETAKIINGKIKSLSSQILKVSSTVRTESTQQEVAGVQSYIGVDLGFTYIDKLSATPFFVTLSPYLTKIDPEKDYKIKTDNLIAFGKSLLFFFTPTFGIGIKETNSIKPIYYVGIGCRLNKMVRISIGGAYYIKPDQTDYTWSWGFNTSVSVSYLSDLIKLITAAQSTIQQ